MSNKNCFELGYIMPAEWERHEATWLAWPHYRNDWPGKFAPVPWIFAELVKKLCPFEKVNILVPNPRVKTRSQQMLKALGCEEDKISFYSIDTNRAWIRDYGPFFIQRKKKPAKAIVDFDFHAWGRYPRWQKDNQVTKKISQKNKLPRFIPSRGKKAIVLEGGSIDVNGQGSLLTTKSCQLRSPKKSQNPGFTQRDYEELFHDFLGVENVLWLEEGITGDDTGGHIDDFCRFARPEKIILCEEKNPKDENYKPLQKALEQLKEMKLEDGKKPEIISLPMPSPKFFKNIRLPASYANFYIANHIVLVPIFHDPMDRIALGILSEIFFDRTVIGIYSLDLVWGLGSIHCLSLQEPAIL